MQNKIQLAQMQLDWLSRADNRWAGSYQPTEQIQCRCSVQGADSSSAKGPAWLVIVWGFSCFPHQFWRCCFKASTFLTTATALTGKRNKSDWQSDGGTFRKFNFSFLSCITHRQPTKSIHCPGNMAPILREAKRSQLPLTWTGCLSLPVLQCFIICHSW